MDELALLLKMMTEPRQYRPERPVVPITQPASVPSSPAKEISAADRKLLDEYAAVVMRCGTGKLVSESRERPLRTGTRR